MSVVTRFAPSPTGFLHIGGARTALFNWLYAKAHNGRMLLRIEDTDRERSTQQAIDAILDSLQWLGLDWDEDVVFQFSRAGRHQEVAAQLVEEGKAYRCYCTPEELEAMRETAKAEGRAIGYDGTWRDRDPSEAPEGIDPVIRLKTQQDGETIIKDKVQGDVTYKNKELDDFVLLRSDGTPTYMLSVVVDDHDMGVTHIVRGDDHLTNAARQTQIYNAMGWEIPVFAHVPLIHGADGGKLSKRHGAIGTEKYRAMGYLPAALRNYLVRLGWSHGDNEIFTTDQAIEWFNLESIVRSPARFDFDKLNHINKHYIQLSDSNELLENLRDIWSETELDLPEKDGVTQEQWQRIELALPVLKERASTLIELLEGAGFLFAERPLVIENKAQKHISDETKVYLAELTCALEEVDDWTVEAVEGIIANYVANKGLKFPKVGQPLRVALTGTTKAPGIYDLLIILGKSEAIARLKDQID